MSQIAPAPAAAPASGRKLKTRAAIVAAAGRVLAERGLSAMTVDQVLEASGVARATFYAHFTDKHDVAREVVAQMWVRASNVYAEFAALPSVEREEVRAWLERAYDRWRVHTLEVVALLRDMPEEVSSASGRFYEDFAALIVGDGSRWRCSNEVALCRARLLILQLERALFDVARNVWRVERGVLIDTLALYWMAALEAP